MKTLKKITICAAGVLLMASCGQEASVQLPGISKAQIDSASYAVGVSLGGMLQQSGMVGLSYSEIVKGMQDIVNEKDLKISQEEIGVIIQTYMVKCQEAQAKAKEQEQAAFLAENLKNEGVEQTASGLQYKIVVPGSDVKPSVTDTVEVKYAGRLVNGNEFDNSEKYGGTSKFALNRVIKGWTEGMQLIGEGGKITLYVPYELGYGPRAVGPEIPAYSTLIFDVELVKVYKAKEENK